MAKKKIIIACGSGGHAVQALILYKELKKDFDVSFLLEKEDPLTAKKITDAPVYTATAVWAKKGGPIEFAFRTIVCVLESFFIFLKVWPNTIIGTGPGVVVPISVWARFFGKKVIFLESWSRVTTKSKAGKFMYYVANKFFVQWPENQKNYKKSVYAGRLG